jgi:hypothetical protein
MPDETAEQFATQLRKMAVNCEFTDVKREIKTAIIQHCLSKWLRRFALRENDLTPDGLLAKVSSLEPSEIQASGMEEVLPKEEVKYVGSKYSKPKHHQNSNCQKTKPTP